MDYILFLLTATVIYSILGLTQNLVLGYIGILYLGHPAVIGVGAYTFSLLAISGTNFFLALFLGGLAAMILAFIISLTALRLKSHYIGMSTLGFLLIFNAMFINLRGVTRGALGIPGIPRPDLFKSLTIDPIKIGDTVLTFNNLPFLVFTVLISLIIFAFMYRLLNSPYSQTMEAIREDETSAKTLGINIYKYKIVGLLVTGFFGGIGGGLLASLLGFINPHNFVIDQLIILLGIVVIGGMASFWGSILGAFIMVFIPEPLRFLELAPAIAGPMRYAIYGLLIILFMLYRPNGILGRRTNIFSK